MAMCPVLILVCVLAIYIRMVDLKMLYVAGLSVTGDLM